MAAEDARAEGDLELLAEAALGAATVQVFGTEPGKLPSVLYDVLARTTDDRLRTRLAAALARCWVYAEEAGRAVPFADEAVTRARQVGEPALLADALDAALTSRWGPDELAARRVLARELGDVAAHLTDPDARLQAHLWGLHVACESLDVHAMHRQMRALELVGEESPRAMFFAASRRAMLDLVRGRADTVEHLLEIASAAADQTFIPDAWMVLACLDGHAATQLGDVERIIRTAKPAEEFAVAEGTAAVHAEAAFWWMAAGEHGRAQALLRGFAGEVLPGLPRDVNYLLILQLVLEVALALGDREVIDTAVPLLAPYAGRAVVNAGAVMFHGTTDDTLSRAFAVQGRAAEAATARARALATYERLGARWWRDRLAAAPGTATPYGGAEQTFHLYPTAARLWVVGRDAVPVAGLRGLGYLRDLVARPGVAVAALDLVGSRAPVVEEAGTGELVDRQALAAYRQRLRDLDAEIAEAEDWADAGRLQEARDERQALLDELARVTGLGSRVRTSGSSQERARVAVKKAISTAIGRIEEIDEVLGHHVRTTVSTGLVCCYDPGPTGSPHWILDAP